MGDFSAKELAGRLFGRNVVIRPLNVVINVVISNFEDRSWPAQENLRSFGKVKCLGRGQNAEWQKTSKFLPLPCGRKGLG
jgi:hypothetical protein